jgi:hypothetical protein
VLDHDPLGPRLIGGVEPMLGVPRVAGEGSRGGRERGDDDGDQTEAAGHVAWIGVSD